MGYFRNMATSDCQICPVSTYSETINAESCTACPDGETIPFEGATSHLFCTRMIPFFNYGCFVFFILKETSRVPEILIEF